MAQLFFMCCSTGETKCFPQGWLQFFIKWFATSSNPSGAPTAGPTSEPTSEASFSPSSVSSASPSASPSAVPSTLPSVSPRSNPSDGPSASPSAACGLDLFHLHCCQFVVDVVSFTIILFHFLQQPKQCLYTQCCTCINRFNCSLSQSSFKGLPEAPSHCDADLSDPILGAWKTIVD